MPRRNKNKAGIAGGRRVLKTEGTLSAVIRGIVVYMEMANASRFELSKEKVLPLGIGIRLQVERDFCMNLLLNMCHLKPHYIQKLRDEVIKDKEKFDSEVKAFCEAIVPGKNRKIIVQSKDFRKEVAALTRRDRGVKGGRVIFP